MFGAGAAGMDDAAGVVFRGTREAHVKPRWNNKATHSTHVRQTFLAVNPS